MTRPILLLNAPAQSGKDTVASILETGYGFRSNSFKNPLFYLFCHTAGFDYEEFMDLYSTDGWKDTPNEKVFDTVSAKELHNYIKDGHFPAKTTFPKVDASIRFVAADSDRKAVIANLEQAKEGLDGKAGTTITA